MPIHYLKTASKTAQTDSKSVNHTVEQILQEIELGGDQVALDYAQKFDSYPGPALLSKDAITDALARVPESIKRDIDFAHQNIERFAIAQKNAMSEFEIEVQPGLFAGQRMIPVNAAGCYIPGGRYSHIASALMTVTTAKVAGVPHITACSPADPKHGVHPAIIYAAHRAGAHNILALGGVQGVASMAFGLFGLPAVDIIVGPGNQFVAEAKRQLFGRVGIDMIAGPTDSLILADETADPMVIATDLVSQAEHGYNSPVWLVTNDRDIATQVIDLMPQEIANLPDVNRKNAESAWRDYGEVILCDTLEEMAATSDEYAPEHLTVQAKNLDWWLSRLTCYGSLFLGEETTVAFGDKATGTNHVLPTSRSARYTGGLSVHKYMKLVTYQRATRAGSYDVAQATARISRMEGMEGHARAADIRLHKYFPDEKFELHPNEDHGSSVDSSPSSSGGVLGT
ncbi:histidinol dehydrogenase [Amylibacter kogurei]|uniref:Histidinol dehydrogenase homolog n=1 Tax=Paramylibacter kogurei TaxID=1889778 RepID=A0A2G5K5A1_9RHOB|nr:histidinol dehydrogenase [Amylibacter kogurei]PIB24696.1 histidinol dehydrogenase [Amylibacter kogurei]